MERSTVSQSVCRGIFLGSNEKVITGGNAPGANLQVLFSQHNSNGEYSLAKVSDLYLNGICADIELCSIPRLAQTHVAVALMNPVSHCSSVSMVNLETYMDSAMLSFRDSNNCVIYKDSFNITSISFCSDLELMAVGNEAGLVSIVDLYSGLQLSTLKVDPSGVSKVKFMRTGQLITIGESSKGQIKVWDLKAGARENEPVISLAQKLSDNAPFSGHNHFGSFSSSSSAARRSRTTCVGVHPVQEKLVSGTSNGLVHLWDLRSAASISFSPHVTADSGASAGELHDVY